MLMKCPFNSTSGLWNYVMVLYHGSRREGSSNPCLEAPATAVDTNDVAMHTAVHERGNGLQAAQHQGKEPQEEDCPSDPYRPPAA